MTGIGIGLSSYIELARLQIVTSGSLIDRCAENDSHYEIGTGSICDLMWTASNKSSLHILYKRRLSSIQVFK
jgi:hypothetical protein